MMRTSTRIIAPIYEVFNNVYWLHVYPVTVGKIDMALLAHRN